MQVLVTGAAGFIGFHTAEALLAEGTAVVGIDNLSNYYDVTLKRKRLERLAAQKHFSFLHGDLCDDSFMHVLRTDYPSIRRIAHMAAQPGVRHSIEKPEDSLKNNIQGQLRLLEYCRSLPVCEHLVYASSSSVYGSSAAIPFTERDAAAFPLSPYAVSKRCDELLTQSYSHLYRLPATGLRLFSVYGPYGRPDMSYYRFTRALYAQEPISLFHAGNIRRDFTYISDIVSGIMSALRHPPQDDGKNAPHRIVNLGNGKPVSITQFVHELEKETGRKAIINNAPLPLGDPLETSADIQLAQSFLGYSPKISLEQGIAHFIAWFRSYHNLS